MSEVIATIPSLPDLLAVFGAWSSVGGAAIGVLVGKASTWRQSFEDIALGAAVGGVLGCVLVFSIYLFIKAIGA